MSDILSKEELRVFVVHPFYHDKIELLEKLKTRTRKLLAMYVPLHSINVHSLRHYISLVPGGIHECFSLYVKVASDIINSTNSRSITYHFWAAFEDYMIECADYFDEYFDQTMMEKLKDLSGAIVAFSNRESDADVGRLMNLYKDENRETEPSCFNCRWCNTYTKWCCFSDESIDGRTSPCAMWEYDTYEKEE